MHPEVRDDHGGDCPSCGMALVPVTTGPPAASDTPAVPIVHVSTERQQLIGVRLTEVREVPLMKALVSAGTLASDETRVVETPSPVGGVVEQVLGNPTGQEVRRGQALLVLRTDAAEEVTVRAPATGHISWRISNVGAKIQPNYNVCTIYDHAGIWVWLEIYESELQWVRVGQSASMTVPAWPGRTFHGTVTQVAPLLSAATHTMRVRVDFPNRDFTLKPGMSAVVEIHADAGTKLAVPESAVIRTGRENIVFVAAGEGAFAVRDVQLGVLVGDQYEVVGGLTAGERIVTSGNFLIDSESQLQGVRAAWDPPAGPGG
ncbi:MAG: efflux RND transporter periplasmic adaptor subunit [Myxococcota bacterium]